MKAKAKREIQRRRARSHHEKWLRTIPVKPEVAKAIAQHSQDRG